MSQLPAEYVKRGFWINLDFGPVMGKTITTDTQTGNLVVALLAILTTLGLSRLWNLITFSYHQIRSDGRAADGLFRQQQAFLRTLPTPATLLSESIKLWWAWRKADNAFLRSSIQILLGLAFTLGTGLIGIFVSLVVDSTDIAVRVDSPYCGPWNTEALIAAQRTNDTAQNPFRQHLDKVRESSRSYARECYQNYSIVPERCKPFVRPSILFSQERLDCPFPSHLCKDFAKPAIRLDSGLVDLNDGFGLNLDPSDRLKVRKRTTCAVLEVENWASVVNWSSIPNAPRPPLPNEKALVVQLGSQPVVKYSYALSLFSANLSSSYTANVAISYLDTENNATSSTFIPPPEMQSRDADVLAIFIAKNGVHYRQPVNDPVFAAHLRNDKASGQQRGGNMTLYKSDFPISSLGCHLQYQFCLAQSGGLPDSCSNLTGIPSLPLEYIPNATSIQVATIQELVYTMFQTDMQFASLDLKVQKLTGNLGRLTSLPDDQWVQEVLGWESFLWAHLQNSMVEYAIGKTVRQPDAAPLIKRNLTDGERELCQMQKMRNPGGFVNINVFALAFVCTFTCVVTIIDLVLLRLLIVPKRSPRIDRWIQDSVYQLQRRAYDGHGEGTWRRLGKEIPLTNLNEKLSELSIESYRGSHCASVMKVQLQRSKTV